MRKLRLELGDIEDLLATTNKDPKESTSGKLHAVIAMCVVNCDYRRTGFNCEYLIIENCEVFSVRKILQSQSALLLYTRMLKSYANAIIKTAMYAKMLECNYFATQLKPVLWYNHKSSLASVHKLEELLTLEAKYGPLREHSPVLDDVLSYYHKVCFVGLLSYVWLALDVFTVHKIVITVDFVLTAVASLH